MRENERTREREIEMPGKPEITCETCGAPVLRGEDDAMRGRDYFLQSDGTWLCVLYVFYPCSEPRDPYRVRAFGVSGVEVYAEPNPHTWGKMRTVAFAVPAEQVPEMTKAEYRACGMLPATVAESER